MHSKHSRTAAGAAFAPLFERAARRLAVGSLLVLGLALGAQAAAESTAQSSQPESAKSATGKSAQSKTSHDKSASEKKSSTKSRSGKSSTSKTTTGKSGHEKGSASASSKSAPAGAAQHPSASPPQVSERAINATMAFEKAPGVLSVSNRSRQIEGLGAYATEPLGLTALGLEDAGLKIANKKDKIEANLGERVRFDPKTGKILPESTRLFDGIARVLAENPETRILVRAHTDDKGDAPGNLRITQQQADAVRAYLIGRGVGEGRISGHGLGETSPISGTKGRFSGSDRAKNRRIELFIEPRELTESERAAATVDAENAATGESEPDAEPTSDSGSKHPASPPASPPSPPHQVKHKAKG